MAKRRQTIPRVWQGRTFGAPARPINPGRKNTGHRMIYRSGGGRYALNVWKSLDQKRRTTYKRKVRQNKRPGGMTAAMNKLGERRKARGLNPVTAKPRAKGKVNSGLYFHNLTPSRLRTK